MNKSTKAFIGLVIHVLVGIMLVTTTIMFCAWFGKNSAMYCDWWYKGFIPMLVMWCIGAIGLCGNLFDKLLIEEF